MFLRKAGLGLSLIVMSSFAHAEFFGPVNGRLATSGHMSQLSVEGTFMTGDDYQHIGARLNFQLSPESTVYGDFGLSEFGEGAATADGNSFGIGIYYTLADQAFLENMDVALHGSYHTASLEADFNNGFGGTATVDFDVSGIVIEAVISGQEPIAENGLMWYANARIFW